MRPVAPTTAIRMYVYGIDPGISVTFGRRCQGGARHETVVMYTP